ncbi:MAG: Crp/Fnr family transcriptional regulator [Ignavibacteriaceae bacterium]|nr:Crp/Fnr family transcriptional regulator [Ignavibacteriaceae bacterium]
MENRYTDKLKETLNSYHELSDSSLEILLQNCEISSHTAETYISRENKPDSSEYFLLEGILHSCHYSESGENITTGFYLPGTVITPHFARTIGGNSIYGLQFLTAGVAGSIPVTILDELRNRIEDIRIFGKKVVEEELTRSVRQNLSFRADSAKERLINLRSEYPNLENMVPHTAIASFLGITPVSFSRLRNTLAKKQHNFLSNDKRNPPLK